jgi:cobalamin biosynthesis Mg chelatase CobN
MKNILLILFTMLLISCGARKAHVTKLETTSSTKLAETTKTDIQATTTKEVVTVQYNEAITLTPVDNSKPIDIVKPDGTKTSVYNAKIERNTGRTTTNASEHTKESVKQEKRADLTIKENMQVKDKQTDRKESYIGLIVTIIVIIIVLLIMLALWKRFKK